MESIISVSELKQQTAAVIQKAVRTGQPITVTQRSKPAVVVVKHEYFRALEEAVMDLTDGLEAQLAKNEPTISLESYIKNRWPNDEA